MKITTDRLREIIEEEVATNESWEKFAIAAGEGFLRLMDSATGRKMVAGTLRGLHAVMKFEHAGHKWALEKLGYETPAFVDDLEASILAGPDKLADFIEGMTDEEALELSEIVKVASDSPPPEIAQDADEGLPSAIEAPALGEASLRKITRPQIEQIIKEEISNVTHNDLEVILGTVQAELAQAGVPASKISAVIAASKQKIVALGRRVPARPKDKPR